MSGHFEALCDFAKHTLHYRTESSLTVESNSSKFSVKLTNYARSVSFTATISSLILLYQLLMTCYLTMECC